MNKSIITTRVRLARNLKSHPFVGKMNPGQKDELKNIIKDTLLEIIPDFEFFDMDKISELQSMAFVESHFISPQFTREKSGGGLLISRDRTVSIMINEEDHLRIQYIDFGECTEKAYDTAKRISDLLDEKLSLAFDDKLGFLTSCPTNLGTGIRVSYMMHLPTLTELGHIKNIQSFTAKFGFTVRGMYGEGSDSINGIYQLSNQISMGISESDTISRLREIASKINENENHVKNIFINSNSLIFEDKIYRNLGILQNARLISYSEFLKCYSAVREGIEADKLNIDIKKFDKILLSVSPNIIAFQNKMNDSMQRDAQRASITNEFIRPAKKSQAFF